MGAACTRVKSKQEPEQHSGSDSAEHSPREGPNPFKDKAAANHDRRERHRHMYEELYSESANSSRCSSRRGSTSIASMSPSSDSHRNSLSPGAQFLVPPVESWSSNHNTPRGSTVGALAESDTEECDVLDEIMAKHGRTPVFVTSEDTEVQRHRRPSPMPEDESEPPIPITAADAGGSASPTIELVHGNEETHVPQLVLVAATNTEGDDGISESGQFSSFGSQLGSSHHSTPSNSPRSRNHSISVGSHGCGPIPLSEDASLEKSLKAQAGHKKLRRRRKSSGWALDDW